MEYGLVGESLCHSYSKILHEKFGMYKYDLYSLSEEELDKLLKSGNFKGLNVTMPYKKKAIKYCDKLSNEAEKIGSVNTLVLDKNNVLSGYNTDYFGLKYTISRSNISLKNKKVIIMGSGGTGATAKSLATDLGAKEIFVSSVKGNLNYKNIYDHKDTEVIINTTPVGMYPKNNEKLIDIRKFENLSGVVDVIYNPFYTSLLLDAKKLKIPFAGGLPMFVAQAKASAELFSGRKLSDFLIEKILKELVLDLSNIILIGMPGSGKSSVSKILSEKLGKKLIDTDSEIEEIYDMSIPKIFEKFGEKEFRKTESEVLKNYGKMNGLVLSLGAGAVTNGKSYEYLSQNGYIYWIKRELDLLERKGRPLSKDLSSLKIIYEKRKPIYESFCDRIVENNSSLENLAERILEDFHENIGY